MLGIDRHNAVKRFRDLIDPERLRTVIEVRFCQDDRPQRQVGKMLAADRIRHFQFILPVALFHDFTFNRIRQRTQTERGPAGGVSRVQYRDHRSTS